MTMPGINRADPLGVLFIAHQELHDLVERVTIELELMNVARDLNR
ncbi:hypothetical protein [Cognatiyoonia sp. IB215182]|nr:hypothetical protein [Cognatiyoonia sp. IB215182]MDX8354525.1 hypothetical protein [Cognatiyoonia sp. IB215182]